MWKVVGNDLETETLHQYSVLCLSNNSDTKVAKLLD